MSNEMREEFESWAITSAWMGLSGECLEFIDGGYVNCEVQAAWLGWQASRESLVIELPAPFAYVGDYAACGGRRILVSAENTDLMCRKIPVYDRAAIEATGLKVKS